MHPIKYSVFGKPQDNNNISNKNQVSDIRDTSIKGITHQLLTKGIWQPLPHICIYNGALPGTGISRNNKNHG